MVVVRARFAVAEQMLSKGSLVSMERRGLPMFLRSFTASEAEALGGLPLNRDVPLRFWSGLNNSPFFIPFHSYLMGRGEKKFTSSWIKWRKDMNCTYFFVLVFKQWDFDWKIELVASNDSLLRRGTRYFHCLQWSSGKIVMKTRTLFSSRLHLSDNFFFSLKYLSQQPNTDSVHSGTQKELARKYFTFK